MARSASPTASTRSPGSSATGPRPKRSSRRVSSAPPTLGRRRGLRHALARVAPGHDGIGGVVEACLQQGVVKPTGYLVIGRELQGIGLGGAAIRAGEARREVDLDGVGAVR